MSTLNKDQLTELTGMFEGIWDEEQSLAATQSISREIIAEKKKDLSAWAEKLEMNPKMVLAVYAQYKLAQQGKIDIGAEPLIGHVTYEDLVFQTFEVLRQTD